MQFEQLTAGHGSLTAVRTGQGRDLVLLHSLLADRHAFDPVLPALAAEHRVTLINLPGFHGSQPTPLALMDAYVATIEDGFQEFGIANDSILIGNGFGGTVALAFALAHPERISKLLLSDAAACFPDEGRKQFEAMAAKVSEGGLGAIAEIAAKRVFSPAYLASHPEAGGDRGAQSRAARDRSQGVPGRLQNFAGGRPRAAAASHARADAGGVRRVRPGAAAAAQQVDRGQGAWRCLCGIAGLRPLPAAGTAASVPGGDQGFCGVVVIRGRGL
jgi:pimeloyl-ACP methyl ester carboxylesterase